ncbi:uncharacterized protein V1513DRAFT_384871 [Lipomyces chichibuensis]|uniref:uncharacterized protein n=1 Tax=Lipomyces chichibuensis TaxID=1546026 RepID=UPI003343F59F
MSTVAIPTTTLFLSSTSSTSTPEPSRQNEEDFNMDQSLLSDIEMLAAEDDDDEMLLDDDAQGEHATAQIQNTLSSPPGSSRMEEDEKDGGFDIVIEEVEDDNNAVQVDEQLLDADGSTPVPADVEEEVPADEVLVEGEVGSPFATVVEETQSTLQLPAEETTKESVVEQPAEVSAEVFYAQESASGVVPESGEEKPGSTEVEEAGEVVNVANGADVAEVAEGDPHLSTTSLVTEDQPDGQRHEEEVVETELASAAGNAQENHEEAPLGHIESLVSQGHDATVDQTTDEVRNVRTDFPNTCVILEKDDRNFLLCPSDDSDNLVAELDAQPILEDYAILSQPLVTMFAVLRGIFNGELAEDCELVAEVPQLGLSVSELNSFQDNVFCQEVTVYDLVELYSELSINDNAVTPNAPLVIHLNAQVRFLYRFNHIAALIRQGKGLQYLYDEDAAAIAKQHPEYHTNGISATDEGPRLDANTTDLQDVTAGEVADDITKFKQEVMVSNDILSELVHADATPDSGDVAFNGADYQEQGDALPGVVNDAGAIALAAETTKGDMTKSPIVAPTGDDLTQTQLEEELNPSTAADGVSDNRGTAKRIHDTLDEDDDIVAPEDKRVKSVSE